ncbi:hypothetical protein CEXT_811311 [Caerostris extrusa]|uniref:Uncharacterized protein n=1 Tax=Caerostris extrusa TaxID=172846 RepID=A0AAV4SJN5_CAEEX|nr:hypothetical protein CEXT_811311 [Caerostris extrusa]
MDEVMWVKIVKIRLQKLRMSSFTHEGVSTCTISTFGRSRVLTELSCKRINISVYNWCEVLVVDLLSSHCYPNISHAECTSVSCRTFPRFAASFICCLQRNNWFMEDGTLTHFSHAVLTYLYVKHTAR